MAHMHALSLHVYHHMFTTGTLNYWFAYLFSRHLALSHAFLFSLLALHIFLMLVDCPLHSQAF
jgi:hypothetical protein